MSWTPPKYIEPSGTDLSQKEINDLLAATNKKPKEKTKMNIPIVSEGIKAVTGLTNSIFGGLDELITSDEERGKIKVLIMEKMNAFQIVLEQESTKRNDADMKSDSVLAKNIRPALTILLCVFAIGLVVFDPENPNVNIVLGLAGTALSFYFTSRGLEKVKRNK